MDWITPVWDGTRDAVHACFPDVALENIFKAIQVERENWVNLVELGIESVARGDDPPEGIVPPWIVVQIPPVPREMEWGINNVVYKPKINIFYAFRNEGDDAASTVDQALITFQDYMLNNSFPFTVLTTDLSLDVSEENPMNNIILTAKAAFTAGAFGFSCIIGFVGRPS